MNRRRFYLFLLVFSIVISECLRSDVPEFTQEGFRVPQPHQALKFPRAHGSHPDFKIEWWYLTGHLQSNSGREFGFQVTFFRFAGTKGEIGLEDPNFGQSQIYSTQVALTDIEAGKFYFDERIDRNGWDAFASEDVLDLKHGPWSMKMTDHLSEAIDVGFHIRDKAALKLRMRPTKPLVVFGPDGTSRKGPDPTARSYYITFTRLAVSGSIEIDGEILSELDESVREEVISILTPQVLTQAVRELDSDDVVDLIEDLEDAQQETILDALEQGERERAAPKALIDDLPLFSAVARAAPAPQAPAAPSEVESRLAGLLPDEMSPREALQALYDLKALLPQKS